MKSLKSITNNLGNVEVGTIPKGYVHLPQPRITNVVKRLRIKYAKALCGFEMCKYRMSGWKPIIRGVVIAEKNRAKVEAELARIAARRLTPEQKQDRRRKKQAKDAVAFASAIRLKFPFMPEEDVTRCATHATEIGSGRVGRTTTCDDPVTAAVVAHIRHEHTDYDDPLDRHEMDRRDFYDDAEFREALDERRFNARDSVKPQVAEVFRQWAGAKDRAA